MQIPDGYLFLPICKFFYILMIPIWIISFKVLFKNIKTEFLPVLAVGVAFSFTLIMLDIGITDGITGHAIGAALLSLLFGPWISSLIITLALLIQAVFFSHAGLISFGVNSFIIAYVSSFIAYNFYKYLTSSSIIYPFKLLSAGLSGYISLSASTILIGVILGLQTLFFHNGVFIPTYFPYSIKLVVSVILFENLLFFSWIEAGITVLGITIFMNDKSLLLKFFNQDKFQINF